MFWNWYNNRKEFFTNHFKPLVDFHSMLSGWSFLIAKIHKKLKMFTNNWCVSSQSRSRSPIEWWHRVFLPCLYNDPGSMLEKSRVNLDRHALSTFPITTSAQLFSNLPSVIIRSLYVWICFQESLPFFLWLIQIICLHSNSSQTTLGN